MTPRLITVTGATGNQGGAVARFLLQHPDSYKVRALTRNPDSAKAKELAQLGADVVQADLRLPETLGPAMEGCWGVFGVTDFYDEKIKGDPNSEEQQGRNLALAARNAGVTCFVWSTLPSSEKLSGGKLISKIYEGKHHVDAYIREIGLPATFVYTGNFYENMVLRGHVKYHKEEDVVEFRQPIIEPKTRLSMLYVEKDLSAITKAIFDQWDSKKETLRYMYLYATNARISPQEIAEVIEKATHKHTTYTVIPTTGVAERDVMFQLYNHLGTMYPGQQIPDPNVTEMLGVRLHGVEDYVRERLLPHLGLGK